MSRFDWYQATVEEPPLWLRGALEEAVGHGATWMESRHLPGYGQAETLYRADGEELLQLNSGGSRDWPHVLSSGAVADEVAMLLRAVVPVHLVARADACEDLDEAGWFDRAHNVLLQVADEKRMAPRVNGDWFGGTDKGRTAYLGAETSAVVCRLYEKGLELRGKFPRAAAEISPTWARLEVQVRPTKREAKLQLAAVPAHCMWGCSSYSQLLASRLLKEDTPRLKVGTVWRASDLERAELHMLRQYGRVFEAMHKRFGSWAEVGEHIGRELQSIEVNAPRDRGQHLRGDQVPDSGIVQRWLREIGAAEPLGGLVDPPNLN